MRKILTALALMTCLATPAPAASSADLMALHAEQGTLREGVAAITGNDAESRAARGSLKFLLAIEHAAQALHRYGLEIRGGARMGLPILRLPVPPNPHPEPIDYAKFRAIFEGVVADLTAAEADLKEVGDQEVKLPLDLLKLRIDMDGDGKASDYESVAAIIGDFNRSAAPAAATVAFDTADIYWLRGYSHFLMGFSQFLLAHDFQEMFDKTFHIYFPNAGLPYAGKLTKDIARDMFVNDDVGDVIAMIHLINWQVTEPERRKDARLQLLAMAGLSRQSWAAARAETDNDREWLPNARQAGALGGPPVDEDVINGWLAVMAEFEAVLDGSKLLPHWRFSEGLNLKRFFDDGKDFDLVLMVAGVDSVPWLEQGPVSDSTTWNNLMGVFRGNFLGYALWFN